MAALGVEYISCVSENTCLCHIDFGSGLEAVRQFAPVVYADVYPTACKIEFGLKESKAVDPQRAFEVNVIFHDRIDLNSADLQRCLDQVRFYAQEHTAEVVLWEGRPEKARMTVLGQDLDAVASIDEVYRIAEAYDMVLDIDGAQAV